MKKLIILLVILFSYLVNAQDFEPTQYPFNINNNPNYLISTDSAEFKQDKFVFNCIWSGDYRSNKALGINTTLNYIKYCGTCQNNPASSFTKNNDYFLFIPHLSWNTGDYYFPFNTIMFKYKANLKITDPVNKFNSRPNDPENNVFGFMHIDSNITINGNDSKLMLYQSQLTSIRNPILSDPWPCDKLI